MLKIIIFILSFNFFLTLDAYAVKNEFNAWLLEFKVKAVSDGISKSVVDDIMDKAIFLPKVLEYDRYQPEFYEDTLTYIKKRSSRKKILEGKRLYKKEKKIIDRIENEFDVEKELLKLKFSLCATKGTAEYIKNHGIKCKIINKVSSGSPHIVDVLDSKKIALVINTGGGKSEHRLNDAIALRRATLKNKVPYCTNMSTALACIEGIKSLKTKKLEVSPLQENN